MKTMVKMTGVMYNVQMIVMVGMNYIKSNLFVLINFCFRVFLLPFSLDPLLKIEPYQFLEVRFSSYNPRSFSNH